MDRLDKHFLKPETSESKFFNNESGEAFIRINFEGTKTTLKGFLNRLRDTTKLVANVMDLNRDHTKNPQALQRTHRFFSLICKFIEFKDLDTFGYPHMEDKVIEKYLKRIEKKTSRYYSTLR